MKINEFLKFRKKEAPVKVDPATLQENELSRFEKLKAEIKEILPTQHEKENIQTMINSVRTELEAHIHQVGESIRKEVHETYQLQKKEQQKQLLYQWLLIASLVIFYLLKTFLRS